MNWINRCQIFFYLIAFFSFSCGRSISDSRTFNEAEIIVDSTRNHIKIVLNDSIYNLPNLSVIFFDSVKRETNGKINNRIINWDISGSKNKRLVNSLTLFSDCSVVFSVSVAVESVEYLKKQYNFTTQLSYLVFERLTLKQKNYVNTSAEMEIKYEPISEIDSIQSSFQEYIKLNNFTPDTNDIINTANQVTSYIWSFYTKTGPSDIISPSMTAWQMLTAIKRNGGSVQCSSTRDLFISIFKNIKPNIETRKVDVFRYWPEINGIVVNGHSVLEIKINDNWVLYDPFARAFFSDNDGRLLNSADIHEKLITQSVSKINIHVVNVPLHDKYNFGDNKKLFDVCEYNYFTHFYNINTKTIVFK